MHRNLRSRFINETKGAQIKEIIIILALIGILSAMLFPSIRGDVAERFKTSTKNIGIAHKGTNWGEAPPVPDWDDDNLPPVVVEEPIMAEITLNTPETLFTDTDISFAIEGEGPFTVVWTGYAGNTDGTRGAAQRYPVGAHTISAEVTDSQGRTKFLSKEIQVKGSYFVYTRSGSRTTITDYTGHLDGVTDVVIPEQLGGGTVTTIRMFAFYNKGLTSVVIPDTVKTIGENAFSRNSITSAKLPNDATSYGNQIFSQNLLTSIEIPESMTEIPYGMFSNNKIKEVVIPNNVRRIGVMAFSYNSLESVTIGTSVETIGQSAFTNNSIRAISLPASVRHVEQTAFYYNRLRNITLNEGLLTIGESAFGSPLRVDNLILPSTLQSVGNNAFSFGDIRSLEAKNPTTEYGLSSFDYNSNIRFIGPSVSTLRDLAILKGIPYLGR